MSKKKSWREKLEGEHPNHGKIVKILIPNPRDVDALMRQIPEGDLVTDERIRNRLAKDNKADATCSKVTGIFIRIAAEVAEEDLKNGKKQITPYWRVIAKDGSLKPKFPSGIDHQKKLLEKEGHKVIQKGKKYFVVDFEKYLAKL